MIKISLISIYNASGANKTTYLVSRVKRLIPAGDVDLLLPLLSVACRVGEDSEAAAACQEHGGAPLFGEDQFDDSDSVVQGGGLRPCL